MYKSISPNLNFVEEEKKVEKFWEDEKIFEKSSVSEAPFARFLSLVYER